MVGQVAADLRAAADLLKRDGWVQGTFYDRSSHTRCALGAINYVTKRQIVRSYDARQAFEDFAGQLVTVWNDTPGRSADEVIAASLTAADAAERDAA